LADGVFDDLKVLDLGAGVPGPYCAKLFSDYGADVIKVEPPAGEPARLRGPYPGDDPDPEKSALFLYLNTNKRGVTLDWRTPRGRELLWRLLAWADVVVENGAPSDLARSSIAWEDVEAVNPALVWTCVTPFGLTGPYRDYPADEITLFAISGRMWSHGTAEREPLRYAPDMAWFQAGATAAVATLGAVMAARRFGIGQEADVSVLEALAGNVDARSIFSAMTGQPAQRPQAVQASSLAGVVPCQDGYMLMIAGGERFFRRLARAIGREDLLQDERFSTPAARQQHAGELDAVVLPWLADRTRREVFEQLQAFSVMCAPVQMAGDAFEDPQLRHRGYFRQVQHPVAGRLPYPGPPFVMERTPSLITRAAPLLGEHNREVYLGLLGLPEDDLAVLQREGTV
jgi:crotonobetainyl-CoA:carnitine CoA-transferase CaiB-like acyl-CoA transferase